MSKNMKVLYVVPTEPLAFQILSLYKNNSGCGLLTKNYEFNIRYHSILVSTPGVLEKNLDRIRTDYDYVVYDHVVYDYIIILYIS